MTTSIENLTRTSEILKASQNWVIFTHKKPDGDAIGSVTALITAGLKLGKNIKWYGVENDLPPRYFFLPNLNYYESCQNNFNFMDSGELYIFLDCANETRSIKGFQTGVHSVNIDHHEDNTHYAEYNCVDGKASSACEMLMRIFRAGNWEINKQIAECLYTGIYTDTGGFSFSSTSARTHKLTAELLDLGVDAGHMSDLINQNLTQSGALLWSRALSHIKIFGDVFLTSWLCAQDFRDLKAVSPDTEGLPNLLMSVRNVKLAVLLTENFNGEIRGSFRSREGINFGAGDIARSYGGGGHARAAGATLSGSLEECLKGVENLLLKKYHDGNNIIKQA